ncbi:MAG: xanthine dehydrogenase family protein subunit M [Syntrophorhabdales bacterium]
MRFDYLAASTIEEALHLLTRDKGETKVLAGGTDLFLQVRSKRIKPEYVVDISDIPDLSGVSYDDKRGLRIGALTTIRTLETSSEVRHRYPILSEAAGQLGSVAIRNVATVGGNLCNARPSAETAQALVALSTQSVIVGPGGERIVPLENFFTGVGTTVLKTGELLKEIQVPILPPGSRGGYYKHSMRGTIDLAIVNAAVVVSPEDGDKCYCRDVRIVLGAVAPTPMRAINAEGILRGKRMDKTLIDEAARAASAEARPRAASIRGSVEYKKEMVRLITEKLLWACVT